MASTNEYTIGFVGLGVMGGPMCRNVALKHPGDVVAFDVQDTAFEILEGTKARRCTSLAERPNWLISSFYRCRAAHK